MSSITQSLQYKTSNLSAELVNTVFGYQKELIQLRQEQEMAIAKESSIIRLKQVKLKNTERIQLLKIDRGCMRTELDANKIEIFKHRELTSDLVYYPIRGRSIPNEILLKCKHLIDAEDLLETTSGHAIGYSSR